jgi:uncharacterized UBP type Zn finger protein
MVQVNDRYEFYDTLDLDREGGKYLAPGADRAVRNTYRLLAVLVHSGGVHGGHYYAYIRCLGVGSECVVIVVVANTKYVRGCARWGHATV